MHRRQTALVVGIFVLILGSGSLLPADPESPFSAAWDDDTRLTGQLSPWYQTQAQPELAGRPLFSEKRSVVWLQDNRLPQAKNPEAWVELWGWDTLPGKVIGCRARLDTPAPAAVLHLVVVPDGGLERPGSPGAPTIRVPIRWVRRAVWQRMTSHYQPSTLFYRDGRQLTFQALRLGEDVVRLLRDEGVEEIPLTAIAELHFPASDSWDAYFEHLAALGPDGADRWVQVETSLGLRVSFSAARFQADRSPADEKPEHWYHLVQPPWSLDPMWLPYGQIRVRRYFRPPAMPLSWCAPAAVRRQAYLGGAWQWRADRNVQGGRLQSGAQGLFQWGFGVQATCDLEFPLHAAVRSFRTRFGLDALAGDGGCVRAEVAQLNGQRRVLHESRLLIGSAEALDTGWLNVHSPDEHSARLLLRVDCATGAGPPGADPLDIRDIFDWLEPVLRLDENALRVEVTRHSPRLVPAWQEWSVTTGKQRNVGAELENRWSVDADRSRYRLAAVARDGELRVSRRVRVSPQESRLTIVVGRPEQSPPSRIEVVVDGQSRADFEVPALEPRRALPSQTVLLSEAQGRSVTIELIQRSPHRAAVVFWDRLALESEP